MKKQVPPDLFQVRAGRFSCPYPAQITGPYCLKTARVLELDAEPGSPGANRLGHQFPALSPQPYIEEICQNLRGDVFQKFIER